MSHASRRTFDLNPPCAGEVESLYKTSLALLTVFALALTAIAVVPAASADDTTCTPWTGNGTAKGRQCVDPDGSCLVYSETYHRTLGYFYRCLVPGSV